MVNPTKLRKIIEGPRNYDLKKRGLVNLSLDAPMPQMAHTNTMRNRSVQPNPFKFTVSRKNSDT